MFGQVIFLLYLPAICFSFGLFPNNDHETQRRQNPEENMVNVSYAEVRVDPCLDLMGSCLVNLGHFLAFTGPEDYVVGGRLVVPCEPNLLEQSWNCINSVSQCDDHDFYTALVTSQKTWDFICLNSPEFIAGRDCWNSPEFLLAINGCGPDTCIPTCAQESVAEVRDCSPQDALLMRLLAKVMTAPMMQSSC